ncbi:MAG TPA: SIMPL domain-containing protein [Gemmatimonadaceae bacterium]|jgi:Uncharacterized conserved protein
MRHRLPLLACTALLAAFVAGQLAAQQPTQPAMHMMAPIPEIVTGAQGEARMTPDRATIYIGVQTRAETAEKAGEENAKRQQAVIAAIRARGIGQDQISTVNYSVYPEQQYHPERGDKEPKIVGYNVTNTVRVEVRNIGQVGALIDEALAKGANSINSLDFYSSNEDDARRMALSEAVSRARGDAEALAKGAGGRIGDLIELSSAGMINPPRPMPMMMAMDARAKEATPINPGEQTITVTVTARWRFLSGEK